ncbi:hypothetical protein KFL_005480070 [Klebsormidium nitens]|uniref:CBS domain-containing protein n=1 Tax=Klebsormidium nitens TaxID=105231 RepID=A0A1Y1IG89_KLENI|nr:hypothetical protein KFL_005480070 [Klebsormidium nitens]|eukprot:GAQ89663.1 hypothetical protein KFL_005480070 [Klebsormidium nitens]
MASAIVPVEEAAHAPGLQGEIQAYYAEAAHNATEAEARNAAFEKVPVSRFPGLPHGTVIEIPSTASVADAVLTLSRHNILSAPVRNVDGPQDASWIDRYLGVVDFPGIVLWVLEQSELAAAAIAAGAAGVGGLAAGAVGALGAVALGATGVGAAAGVGVGALAVAAAAGVGVSTSGGPASSGPAAADYMEGDFYKALQETDYFKTTTVGAVAGTFRWGPFLPVQLEDRLLTLLLLTSKYRLRSVPVVEPGRGALRNLVTQSAIVRWLADCAGTDWYDSVANKTLTQLGLSLSPAAVVSVSGDSPVLTAFQLMKERGVGGVPVLDGEGGPIIGNVSARDIRFLLTSPDYYAEREKVTVRQFVSSAGAASPIADLHLDTTSPAMSPPITCTADSTLADVVATLSRARIHRIYVVDAQRRVQGVVTLRWIISRFVTEPKDYFKDFFEGVVPGATVSSS